MALSTDVTLPIEVVPNWPHKCVECGKDEPDAHVTIRAGRVGWDQLLTLGWAWGTRPRVTAPCCSGCSGKLLRRRRIRWAVESLMVLAAALLILGFVAKWQILQVPGRRWIMAGIVLVVLMPLFFLSAMFPEPLDATARGKKLDYEFRDKEYAELFRYLNTTLYYRDPSGRS